MITAKMLHTAPPFELGVLPQSDRFFQWVEEIAELVHYARGAWIHGGHDAPDAIYIIHRGRVGVSAGEAGAVLQSGELFGELFVDDHDLRGSYLARALEESAVWVLRRERVQELLGERAHSLRGLIGYKHDLVFLFQK